MAKPPLPRIGPRLRGFWYPCRSISGVRMEPSMAVVPILEPLKVERIAPEPTATPSPVPTSTPTPTPKPTPTPAPAELLANAELAMRNGDYGTAAETYRALVARPLDRDVDAQSRLGLGTALHFWLGTVAGSRVLAAGATGEAVRGGLSMHHELLRP